MTDKQIIGMIPKSKREAVYMAWEDSDGIWIMLNEGWNADNMDNTCRVIHVGGEDEPKAGLIKELRYQISGIKKVY